VKKLNFGKGKNKGAIKQPLSTLKDKLDQLSKNKDGSCHRLLYQGGFGE